MEEEVPAKAGARLAKMTAIIFFVTGRSLPWMRPIKSEAEQGGLI